MDMALPRWAALRSLAAATRAASRPGGPSMGERLAAVPRLVRATARGDYPGTTPARLLALGAALAYVVSPVDVVPEAFLAVLGLADDAVVMTWLAASVINETESFLKWERAGGRGSGGRRGRRDGGNPRGDDGPDTDTVQGHVVG
jgi:uncharacterized membrane protein YkvA (DUF1232 family)